jgi:hypothetical protein
MNQRSKQQEERKGDISVANKITMGSSLRRVFSSGRDEKNHDCFGL